MPQQAPPSQPRRPLSSKRESELSYHSRKCSICRHPQRAEIEQAFLDWDCLSSITAEYHLPGRAALYRHARAVGLFARRNRGLRGALARIIEKASEVEPDALSIVRAIEVFARINDDGEWIAPPPQLARVKRDQIVSENPERDSGETPPAQSVQNAEIKSLHVRVEQDATR
jgi:hypothetical protein